MQLICPHCNKSLDVSQEEIALRGGTIVCPQCLGSYHIDTDLTAEQVLASRGKKVRECRQCNRRLPDAADIAFCPYCGSSLVAEAVEPAKSHPDEPQSTIGNQNPYPTERSRNGRSKHHTTRQRPALMPTIHYQRFEEPVKPASVRFQAFAWALILTLLAVLGFILYKSYLLLQLAND